MYDPQLRIDYRQIDFPSDRITVGEVRRRFGKPDFTFEENGHELDTIRFVEEGVVSLGFASALGDTQAQARILREIGGNTEDRAGAEKFLTEQYVRLGLADGPEAVKQVFRRLEAAGAQQAREQGGRTGR